MADKEHIDILKQGIETWNQWRKENPGIKADLHGVDLIEANLIEANLIEANLSRAYLRGAILSRAILSEADLRGADLRGADLREANLIEANLIEADLRGAILSGAILIVAYLIEANLIGAYLRGADLRGADLIEADISRAYLRGANLREANLREAKLREANLREANLCGANLSKADLTRADLREADLTRADLREADLCEVDLRRALLINATLVETNLEGAQLMGCSIYGMSAWGLKLEGAVQTDLIITPRDEPTIRVDNLEVAQFIYLLLNSVKLRDVIDTITSRVVLILGHFTPERKDILDAIRDELRNRDYLPILFDLDKPASRDLTETVRILAHMARFIVADITEPRSIPQELQAIVPHLAVPVQPLLLEGATGEYAMFQDLKSKYHWVLAAHRYRGLDGLLASLEDKVIAPAEGKAKELASG